MLRTFRFEDSTLLINYTVDVCHTIDQYCQREHARENNQPLPELVVPVVAPEIFGHHSKSSIKWRVHVDLNAKKLCIEPVNAAINKIFKYELSVTVSGDRTIYGLCVYDGTTFECSFPKDVINSIAIKIIYPWEAVIFCACSVKIPIAEIESKTLLPKTLTNTRSRDKFADVQFIVEDKVITAHKIILADRSEVFYKLFTWNVNGATNNSEPIPIADVSYDGFNHFIDAIYYATTPTDLEICLEMVSLAEKYDVQDIKTAVGASVIASINMDNAIRILIISYLNNADTIKKGALDFCAKNAINEMNGNKELAKYPDLLSEVFKQISLAKNS